MHKHTKKRRVILFTLFYPFTHQGVAYDVYVKDEVQGLAQSFDTVDIVSLSTGQDGQLPVPPNVRVHNAQITTGLGDKLGLLKWLFNKHFLKEVQALKSTYGRSIDLALFKAILFYAIRAGKYAAFIESLLQKQEGDEEVWIYAYWNMEYALAATMLKDKYPVKVMARTHSLDLYFDRMPENYQPFKRQVYQLSDLFVFISKQGMNYFFEKHKIPVAEQGKSLLNYIGIENPQPPYKKSLDKIVLLSNAWIQPLKRIDLLIESLALIDDIPIEWIHVGDDYGTNRFPEIKDMAQRLLGHKRNIQYEFTGRLKRDELFEMYHQRSVNLFINLSTTEGTPVSMMEAFSYGVPVIGTSVGGVPEIVEDTVNGFLLPVDVPASGVADKMKTYFRLSDNEKQKLFDNARLTWDTKFNAERNSTSLINRILAV